MDAILSEFSCANAFSDEILVISKSCENEHIALVACKFARKECECLGHRITNSGITPLVRKTDPIDKLDL